MKTALIIINTMPIPAFALAKATARREFLAPLCDGGGGMPKMADYLAFGIWEVRSINILW